MGVSKDLSPLNASTWKKKYYIQWSWVHRGPACPTAGWPQKLPSGQAAQAEEEALKQREVQRDVSSTVNA